MSNPSEVPRPNRWRRQTLIVDVKNQGLFIAYAVFLSCLILALHFTMSQILNATDLGSENLPVRMAALSIGVFLSVCFALLIGIIASNKLLGPIWKLQQHMEQVVKGQQPVKPFALRKGDRFSEMAEVYNRLLEKMPPASPENNDKKAV